MTITTPYLLKQYLNKLGMPAEPNMYVTEHFTWLELLKNQKELPSIDVLNNLLEIATVLETYRVKYFNNQPIIITSGWRSITYNANMKPAGAKNSFHCKGMALDFVVKGYTPQQVQKILDPVHKGGMEFAPTWTHIDIRGYKARFTP